MDAAMTDAISTHDLSDLLGRHRRREIQVWLRLGAVMLLLSAAFYYTGAFDLSRYVDAAPTILHLAIDSLPPDFSRWHSWGRPLLETLATGLAGTALGAALALPLAAVAARNVGAPAWLGSLVRFGLNAVRSLPGLIWGVIFVAAVGFGPLPGVLALGVHSTGMLGKLYSEAIEHVDPAPGAALRAHGTSPLGIFRFAILPQAMPRLADATFYRIEHNVRAAMTLGLVGAGGLGLEIITAFHLFEYREASALILVLLGIVTTINYLSAALRQNFLNAR
jgi:phosphonate transport system permease protein